MKKLLSILLTVVLSVGVFGTTAFAALKGDVDGDGSVTAADARLALRRSVDLEENFTEELEIAADFDGDGSVTAADARSILRLSVGLGDETTQDPDNSDEPGESDNSTKPDEPVVNEPSAKELKFYETLFETAHPYLGKSKSMFNNDIMKNFQKWCCVYTIRDVFRPALEEAGYSDDEIDLLAPNKFSKNSIAKAMKNGLNISWAEALVADNIELYVPSLLADYYIKTPEAGQTYFLYDYYDDIVELKIYKHSDEDRENYVPKVGDVLFMSNKTKTYENGYPTVDHTAQIIEVYDDGTFLCTEGSLVDPREGDNLARVRERKYHIEEDSGTYVFFANRKIDDGTFEYFKNSKIIVLLAFQPNL